MLPPNALGRDFRPRPYVGLTDSGTGIEASVWGVFGLKLGWVEGVEFNLLGFVAGLDLREPAIKLPGYGRIGFERLTANVAPAAECVLCDLVQSLPRRYSQTFSTGLSSLGIWAACGVI